MKPEVRHWINIGLFIGIIFLSFAAINNTEFFEKRPSVAATGPPFQVNFSLTTSDPLHNTFDIVMVVSFSDYDGNTQTYSGLIKWFKNGTHVASKTITSFTQNGYSFSKSFGWFPINDGFYPTDIITATFSVTDSSGYTTSAQMCKMGQPSITSFTLANRNPTISSLSIIPENPTEENSPLSMSATYSDPDQQDLIPSYLWTITSGSTTTTQITSILSNIYFKKGDTVTAQLNVSDRITSASSINSVIIGNSLPHVGTIVLSAYSGSTEVFYWMNDTNAPTTLIPESLNLFSSINAFAVVTDPDGDNCGAYFQFYRDRRGTISPIGGILEGIYASASTYYASISNTNYSSPLFLREDRIFFGVKPKSNVTTTISVNGSWVYSDAKYGGEISSIQGINLTIYDAKPVLATMSNSLGYTRFDAENTEYVMYRNESVTISARVVDYEGDNTTTKIIFGNTDYGFTEYQSSNISINMTIPANMYQKGDLISVKIAAKNNFTTIYDESSGKYIVVDYMVSSFNLRIMTSPPQFQAAYINTPTAKDHALNLTITSVDNDANDPIFYSYLWQKQISGSWQYIVDAGINLITSTLSPTYFNKGDIIRALITPYNEDNSDHILDDVDHIGNQYITDPIQIGNYAPVVLTNEGTYSMVCDDEKIYAFSEITMTVTVQDLDVMDTNTLSCTFSWMLQKGTARLSVWNDTGYFNASNPYQFTSTIKGRDHPLLHGYTLIIIVYANDGSNLGNKVTFTASKVENSIPVLTDATWNNTVFCDGTDLSIQPNALDDDGDTIYYEYQYSVFHTNTGITEVFTTTSNTLSYSKFAHGDVISVNIFCYDIFGGAKNYASKVVTLETTIMNSPPILKIAALATDISTAKDMPFTLECIDIDGDNFTVEYLWYLNGKEIAGWTNNYLPHEYFSRGDYLMVKIRVKDTYDNLWSAWMYTDTVQIKNALPVAISCFLEPLNLTEPSTDFYKDDIIGFNAYGTDADADSVVFTHVDWYVNDKLLEWAGSSLNASSLHAGDRVYAILYPFDGFEEGSPIQTETITILNVGRNEGVDYRLLLRLPIEWIYCFIGISAATAITLTIRDKQALKNSKKSATIQSSVMIGVITTYFSILNTGLFDALYRYVIWELNIAQVIFVVFTAIILGIIIYGIIAGRTTMKDALAEGVDSIQSLSNDALTTEDSEKNVKKMGINSGQSVLKDLTTRIKSRKNKFATQSDAKSSKNVRIHAIDVKKFPAQYPSVEALYAKQIASFPQDSGIFAITPSDETSATTDALLAGPLTILESQSASVKNLETLQQYNRRSLIYGVAIICCFIVINLVLHYLPNSIA